MLRPHPHPEQLGQQPLQGRHARDEPHRQRHHQLAAALDGGYTALFQRAIEVRATDLTED